jgi:hypothetical protein
MIDSDNPAPGVSASEPLAEASAAARPAIRPDMTVRQVAADYPGCREVLRRHGEPEDRPAKFGHLEPLSHFARRQGIELSQLLAELAAAAGVGVDEDSTRAGLLHRPFVVAALAVTLSLGAGWGALLLFRIGQEGTFAAVSDAAVVAHGEAQLWGFVALFVTGIALRYLPMVTSGPRPGFVFCRLLLGVLLFGIAGGFLWSLLPAEAGWLGPASGAGLLAGAGLFLAFLFRQLVGKLRFPWGRFILAAGAWMVVWAGATLVLRINTASAGPGEYGESARRLLMELGIFGFALNAIYGFGQRLLSGIVGSATPRGGPIEAAFWLHNLGVLAALLAYAVPGPILDCLDPALLTAGAFAYAAGLRGFRRVRRSTPRPEVGAGLLVRYVQLAFFWLLAGLVLMIAGSLYWEAHGLAMPHAYLGAVRHALTVGFMTTLILGVGQRLLPILGHTLLAWPRLVAPIFGLIAAGNLLRVSTEMATLAAAPAFDVMPFSSLLELAALTLFTANALRTLWPPSDPVVRTRQASDRTSVAALLAEYPWLEDHLLAWGLGYVGRVRSVPRELTLGTLARSERANPAEIVARTNELLRSH